jgi:predicted amidophosphoribosyltransferase
MTTILLVAIVIHYGRTLYFCGLLIVMMKKNCPHCNKVLPEKLPLRGISPICPFCGRPIGNDYGEYSQDTQSKDHVESMALNERYAQNAGAYRTDSAI